MNYTFKFLQADTLRELGPNSALFSQLVKLDFNVMKYSWSFKNWEEGLASNPHWLISVMLNASELISFALWQSPHEGDFELLKIATLESFQGKGLSQLFWQENLKYLSRIKGRSVILEVEEENLRAIDFYQKAGFTLVSKRKAFYSDGANALCLNLKI